MPRSMKYWTWQVWMLEYRYQTVGTVIVHSLYVRIISHHLNLCMSVNSSYCLFTSPLCLWRPPLCCSLHISLLTAPLSPFRSSVKLNASFGAITLEGEAPLSNYQQALDFLTYELQPFGEPPCPLERAITVTVYGGRLVVAMVNNVMATSSNLHHCSSSVTFHRTYQPPSMSHLYQ